MSNGGPGGPWQPWQAAETAKGRSTRCLRQPRLPQKRFRAWVPDHEKNAQNEFDCQAEGKNSRGIAAISAEFKDALRKGRAFF